MQYNYNYIPIYNRVNVVTVTPVIRQPIYLGYNMISKLTNLKVKCSSC